MSIAGIVDPSMYIVLLKAKEVGWDPRPPNLKFSNKEIEEIIDELSKSSEKVTSDGFLDYLFATALHERKHFYDMHFSSILWRKFLAWFHAASNIFQIINNLRDKDNITLPLYDKFGNLRNDLPLDSEERSNIEKACNQIFSMKYPVIFDYIFESSATIIQFVPLIDLYIPESLCDEKDYGYKYYLQFFKDPIKDFQDNYDRAFAFYNFCTWFCSSQGDVKIVKETFLRTNVDIKDILKKLLRQEGFYERKLKEIIQDSYYLLHHARYYRKASHPTIIDMKYILVKLIEYRIEFFKDMDLIIDISSKIDHFMKWINEEGIIVPFLVDFGEPLNDEQEISESYKPSRWICPRNQFFYYYDFIGKPLFDFYEIDDLLWIQHLTNFILNPFLEWINFDSVFTKQDFLGFHYKRVF